MLTGTDRVRVPARAFLLPIQGLAHRAGAAGPNLQRFSPGEGPSPKLAEVSLACSSRRPTRRLARGYTAPARFDAPAPAT